MSYAAVETTPLNQAKTRMFGLVKKNAVMAAADAARREPMSMEAKRSMEAALLVEARRLVDNIRAAERPADQSLQMQGKPFNNG